MRTSLIPSHIPSLVTAAMILAVAHIAASQNPATRPTSVQGIPSQGAISGTVVDGSTGAPVPGAIVGLTVSGTPLPAGYQARQMSDDKGRFAFANLPNDGVFQISAGRFGYLDGGYGRDVGPSDPLRSVVIATGSWAGNLRVNLWRPAAISGMIRDETGEPVVGVFVRALARIRIAGRDELAAGPVTMSDDYGRYRITGLVPGRYVIQVPTPQMSVPGVTRIGAAASNMPEGAIDVDETSRLVIGGYPLPPPSVNGRAMAYGVALHPTASQVSQAATVDVRFGDDRPGIDVSLTPVATVRVSGMVEGPAEALVNLTLRLLPAGLEGLGPGAEVATALVAANGSFTFLNVPAGSYTLDAPVTFNEYTIRSGATLSGSFVGSRGSSLPAPPPRFSFSRSSQEIGLVPGVSLSISDYRGATGASVPNFTARTSVTVGGTDVTGLVVRLRPSAVLRGTLTIESDPAKPVTQSPPRFGVFMDPAGGESRLGQPRGEVSPGNNTVQEFVVTGIQPGEYLLRVQAGGAWLVKSIQWRGRDYTTTPFDAAGTDDFSGVSVTVTNALPTVGGSVRRQDGSVPETGLVIVFPVEPALRSNSGLWSPRMTSTTLQSNGMFRLTSVPAGEYFVAAIDRSRMAGWRDPEFLSLVERQATRMTLAWGETVSKDLTIVVLR